MRMASPRVSSSPHDALSDPGKALRRAAPLLKFRLMRLPPTRWLSCRVKLRHPGGMVRGPKKPRIVRRKIDVLEDLAGFKTDFADRGVPGASGAFVE